MADEKEELDMDETYQEPCAAELEDLAHQKGDPDDGDE